MPRIEIPIYKEVLVWARETAGLSVLEAAQRLGITEDELVALEKGSTKPTKTVFGRMANVYHRSPTVLMMPSPPPFEALPHDFRTIGGQTPKITEAILAAFREARQIQEDVTSLVNDDPELLTLLLPQKATLSDDTEKLGEQVRKLIGVTGTAQRRWPWRDAFKYWRARVQKAFGLLVLQKKMPLQDCRGFALWDDDSIPAIVINKDDIDEGKIFTLFHELGHIILRQGAICLSLNGRNEVEHWCNDLSGATLLPIGVIRTASVTFEPGQPRQWSVNEIVRIAHELRVSRDVVALRFMRLGGAFPDLYDRVDAERGAGQRSSGGGPILPHYVRLNEVGRTAASVVLGALQNGLIDITEAAEILRLKPKWFNVLETQLASQQAELLVS